MKPASPFGTDDFNAWGPEQGEVWGEKSPHSPRASRGCLFYGCLVALGLALILGIGVGVSALMFYRFTGKVIAEFTDEAPVAIEVLADPAPVLAGVENRGRAFETAARAGRETTLRLTADEINAIIASDDDLRGRVFVFRAGDDLRARLSIPLGQLGLPNWFQGGLKGRYLNGEATFVPALEDGKPVVTFRDVKVGGRAVPADTAAQIKFDEPFQIPIDGRQINLDERITDVRVENGELVIRAGDPDEPDPEAPDSDTPDPEPLAPERDDPDATRP